MCLRLSILTAVCLGVALPATAGQKASAAGTTATSTPSVDVSRLPVNVGRIGRQIRQAETREERNGLQLHYTIQVYGQAPKIKLITPLDNLLTGDAPGTAPTHADMLQMMTPREFSHGATILSIPRRK